MHRYLCDAVLKISGLVCFWDFQGKTGSGRVSKGPSNYVLEERRGPIERRDDGVFGKHSAHMKEGQWFCLPREACPALNIYGEKAQITVIAWLKREKKSCGECEAIAGMWDETNRKRQYCLFLNLSIWDSSQQVAGHISANGGTTPGYPWCMDASIGSSRVPYGKWQCVAFTYDSLYAKSYLNGTCDYRNGLNPYRYEGGIFDGGMHGADFTVGCVNRGGCMGNWFTGSIGGLAVFSRALNDEEMFMLCNIQECY